MSSVLVQEIDRAEKHVYLVSKVFRGFKSHYQKIEKLTLVIVVVKRKLRQYFKNHKINVKNKYRVRQVLKKPDLARRMVSWAVELSKYEIQYVPGGASSHKL